MGGTYTKRPARSVRDALRLMIGDTNASDPLHSDEEADYYLGLQPENAVLAAAEACEADRRPSWMVEETLAEAEKIKKGASKAMEEAKRLQKMARELSSPAPSEGRFEYRFIQALIEILTGRPTAARPDVIWQPKSEESEPLAWAAPGSQRRSPGRVFSLKDEIPEDSKNLPEFLAEEIVETAVCLRAVQPHMRGFRA